MFLSFFRLSTLTFEVVECHIQRIGAEADSDDLPNCRLSGGIRSEFNQPKCFSGLIREALLPVSPSHAANVDRMPLAKAGLSL